jgi:hypothetical protein
MVLSHSTDRLARVLRQLRVALGGAPKAKRPCYPDIIVHDPAAQRPHDLDDPFFDGAVQDRMGNAIADAGRKK